MTAEEFAGAFSHLLGGLYVERSAILPPTERIDAIALSADGRPVVGGMAALIKHGESGTTTTSRSNCSGTPRDAGSRAAEVWCIGPN
jgi:hypothetical protein